jgi:hypothetical protein
MCAPQRQLEAYPPAVWHSGCSKTGMISLIFLGLAIICALISRILLLIAAVDISV